jgi:hypothetical protein
MDHQLQLEIQQQPCNTTCGPTCLQAVYNYHGDRIALPRVIEEATALEEGGTLAVMLGCHALRRGYDVSICTFNLQVFDPTWFAANGRTRRDIDLADQLRQQAAFKQDDRLSTACDAYCEFLSLGGTIQMEDLRPGLLRRFLKQNVPLLTGLSATYLYHEPREIASSGEPDDLRGIPSGHFVVLCGYRSTNRSVLVADPWTPNPLSGDNHYEVDVDRVICAILLGILTYDANLLIVRPGKAT